MKTEISEDKRERGSEHLCAQRDMGERDCGLFGGSFAVCYAVKPLDHGLHQATFQGFWVEVEILVVQTSAQTEGSLVFFGGVPATFNFAVRFPQTSVCANLIAELIDL